MDYNFMINLDLENKLKHFDQEEVYFIDYN